MTLSQEPQQQEPQRTDTGNRESDWPGFGDMMSPVKSGDYPVVGFTQAEVEDFINSLLTPN